jgi:hypothetical protein
MEQFSERFRVSPVSKKRALAACPDESLVLELVEVMRKVGGRDLQLRLDLSGHEAVWMSG